MTLATRKKTRKNQLFQNLFGAFHTFSLSLSLSLSLVNPLVEGQDRHDVGHDDQRRDDEQAVADGRLRVDDFSVKGKEGVEDHGRQNPEDLERGDLEASSSVHCGGLVGVGGEGEEEVGRGRGESGEGGLRVFFFFFFFQSEQFVSSSVSFGAGFLFLCSFSRSPFVFKGNLWQCSYLENKRLGGRRRGRGAFDVALHRRRLRHRRCERSTSNGDASAARSRSNRRLWPRRASRSGQARARQQRGARGSDGEHADGEKGRKGD